MLVDEFQDLNLAQYGVVTQLAAEHRNLFAVGDDEQSIFSWTGADRRIFDRFQDDFPEARRSSSIRTGAAPVRSSTWRVGWSSGIRVCSDKDIAAPRKSPYDVVAYAFDDEAAEAEWLVADLLEDRLQTGTPWGEYALLYRKHFVGRALEGRGCSRPELPAGSRAGRPSWTTP